MDDLRTRRKYRPMSETTGRIEIIYGGTRVLIPTAMRPQMLEKTHFTHLGAEGCMRLARDTSYWPSIHHDIKYLCDNCSMPGS